MFIEDRITLQDFWCIGISYHNTTTETRSKFAVNSDSYELILENASQYGVHELFVLSTCNRTEIYGISKDPELMMALLCHYTQSDIQEFKEVAYQKNSSVALQHLFNVAGGLDSQILGDYEIVGQLKNAFNFSKSRSKVNYFMERLFATVLQACRSIRSETALSCGTVSVAYAAVQFAKQHCANFPKQKVLILGIGEIGKNTCKNLVNELSPMNISVINRTEQRAEAFANELGIKRLPFTKLQEAINTHDIIIVATNATEPIINVEHISDDKERILIDLSIPNNIDSAVKELPNVTLANVDDLSQINDHTLMKRQAEVPKAKALIAYHIHQFAEWYIMRQNVPFIKAAKERIHALNSELSYAVQEKDVAQQVQKVLNNMAQKLKNEPRPGCNYIEAMNDYLNTSCIAENKTR